MWVCVWGEERVLRDRGGVGAGQRGVGSSSLGNSTGGEEG